MLYAIHFTVDQIGQILIAVIIGVGSWYAKHDRRKKAEELATQTKETADDLSHKTAAQAADLKQQGEEIHVLVNSRLTAALARIAALEKALTLEPGAPIPPKS